MIFEEGDTVLVHKSYVEVFGIFHKLKPKDFNFFIKEIKCSEKFTPEEYKLYSNKHKSSLIIFIYEENEPLFTKTKLLLIEKYEF